MDFSNTINGHTIDPKGMYDVQTIRAIFHCKPSTIHSWIRLGRLAEPYYPLGKENSRSPHFWKGEDLLKCFMGQHYKGDSKK